MGLNKLQLGLLSVFALLLTLTLIVCSAYVLKESGPVGNIEQGNITSERSDEFKKMLMPISDVESTDVLLDISENSTKHINGSVVIPYTDFILGGGLLKPVPVIAEMLGDAGISRHDKVVVYGECMACGGGPAPATYVYWMMKCLGQENIRVLDGTVEDWEAAGGFVDNKSAIRPSTNYTPKFSAGLFAAYGYVKSGKPQIVDARYPEEFDAGSIPGAINIPYDNVLNNRTIKNESELKIAFANLSIDRPVVVFTDTGIKASVVWFSLKLMGYDALLYSWQDWQTNKQIDESKANADAANDNMTNGKVINANISTANISMANISMANITGANITNATNANSSNKIK